MKLNDAQQRAIEHDSGPLLIIAGAGTGKTTILTEKIAYLIRDKKINHQAIFAATFTQKSAEEMLGRLDNVMPLGYRAPWIGTFHALADRILRDEALEIGLDPGFELMSGTDQWMFLQEHIFYLGLNYFLPLGNPNRFISALSTFFSRIQDELVEPEAIADYARQLRKDDSDVAELDARKYQELAQAYERYRQLKIEYSLMDFGDLISHAIDLFTTRPNILHKYRSQFEYVLIDEFQDTNYSQYKLITLLAPEAHNPQLSVVGDDDQAIYKFRGASIANILEFKQDYPQASEIVTTVNYRSPQALLDASYRLVSNNNPERLESRLGIDKKLVAYKADSTPPTIIEFDAAEAEVRWTVEEIEKLVTSKKFKFQDIAILTRSNAQLDSYVVAMQQAGIPYQLIANRGLYDTPEIVSLISWLRVLADPNDDVAMFHYLQQADPVIPQSKILQLIKQSQLHQQSYWKEVQDSEMLEFNFIKEQIKLSQSLSGELSVTDLILKYLINTPLYTDLIHTETLENQLKVKNITLFLERIRQYERRHPQSRLIQFLKSLEQWQEAGENPAQAQIEDIDTVRLMTVHSAKGLEFPVVFVGSLVAGRFPSTRRKDPIELPNQLLTQPGPEGDYHMAEERRLFYVAMTRAKIHLYLTYALDYGGKKKWKQSGFIAETGLDVSIMSEGMKDLPISLPFSEKESSSQVMQPMSYEITTFSYSKLDTFKVCPLKFKYRYLLSIPAKPHHTLSFGRTIHLTLQQFHEQHMHGKSMSLQELLSLYEKNFINEGYESPEHQQIRFDSGKKALSNYYSLYPTLFHTPVMLEQSFTLRFGKVKFVGKIDRIDQDTQGNYELIDYKTGSIKTQKQVDQNDQLTLYGIAAQQSLGIQPSYLSLYFIDAGEKMTTTRTNTQLTKAYEKLGQDINKVQQSDFPPKPDPVTCGFCEYYDICPFRAKKKI